MKRFILAIDSFKGCLSSVEVENAVEEGILSVFQESEIVKIPIADGGEGTLSALSHLYKCRIIHILAHDPLMRLIRTEYAITEDGSTALIEMAKVCGLTLVSRSQRNPMSATSFGLGELILDAMNRGCKHFIIGLGGSATSDGGLGMLQALKFNIFDENNHLLDLGGRFLSRVYRIEDRESSPRLKELHFTIACDVSSPLYGENGAACVFAPQKGADVDMVHELDKGLYHYSLVLQKILGRDISKEKGVGAAGGLGAAFKLFPQVEFKSGIELLLDLSHFEDLLQNADFVFTGEGRMDKQTLMGKVSWGVSRQALAKHIPVVALCGSLKDRDVLIRNGFSEVYPINPPYVPLSIALLSKFAYHRIRKTTSMICGKMLHSI